jgi:hypothetical protein
VKRSYLPSSVTCAGTLTLAVAMKLWSAELAETAAWISEAGSEAVSWPTREMMALLKEAMPDWICCGVLVVRL